MLTTQPRPFNLTVFFNETDTGSALTEHKATRVEAQAKSLRMCKIILLFFFAM